MSDFLLGYLFYHNPTWVDSRFDSNLPQRSRDSLVRAREDNA